MAEKEFSILIVDDEEDILHETKDILERKGMRVFTALDSDQALAIFRTEHPRLCILDVHMPKSRLDGIGILQEIRSLDKDSYCIMLSRVDEPEKVEAARSAGANRYVLKPLDYPELLDLIDEARQKV